jgi:D-alanyl-D-alanine carboxypeptidase/D-alanyl-D-alanine-endopeptidase (penicillin-binding protein 4)
MGKAPAPKPRRGFFVTVKIMDLRKQHWLRCASAALTALALLGAASVSMPAQARPKTIVKSAAVKSPRRAAPSVPAALPPEIARMLARADVPASHVAMLVAPVVPPGAVRAQAPSSPAMPASGAESGGSISAPLDASAATPRLRWRADAPMDPASVMKLVTTYAGLDLLGPDYLWKTRVYAQGAVTNGALHGNLVIEGGGDPKLVLERLTALMQAIQARGVRVVEGDILLSNRVFDLPPHDPAAFDDDPLRPYNAGPDGLLINFGALIFQFSPDPATGRARVETVPPIAGVQIPAEVPGEPGACGNWRAKLALDFADPAQARFTGGYPLACGDQQWALAYPDAAQFAPRVIEALWRASGGALTGQVKWLDGPVPARAKLLLTDVSPPLADIIADVNKFSNNVMAQQIFLTLSAAENGDNRNNLWRGSFARSRQRVARWWRGRFGLRAAPVLENGAGLSRNERISAASLVALLQQAANDPAAAGPFMHSLSIAGVDGTLTHFADRHPGSQAIGKALLKTGTLRDTVAIAGYVPGRSGRLYAIAGLINDPHAPAARPALEQLVEWTLQDQP